jgi:signal transduction histidine kinase
LQSRGIAVELDLVPDLMLTAGEQRLIFRIAQECFTNTARHAKATHLHVQLHLNGEKVVFDIRDNGTGFDAEAVLGRRPDGHFGLHILGDVASAAGAHLRLATATGAGTHWQLQLPTSAGAERHPITAAVHGTDRFST